MDIQKDSQRVAKLHSWCTEVGLDPNYAFVLYDIPADTDTSDIEDNVHSVKAFGRVKVRYIQIDLQRGSNLVLCECCQDVAQDHIPPHLHPLKGGSAWTVFLFSEPGNPADDFLAKLYKLMTEEGKTVNDVHALLST